MTLAGRVAVTTASLVVGRVLAVLAGIVSVALATRYLGVTGFGALTLAMAIAAFVALLTDLGLSTMAAREIAASPAEEREIVGNVLTLGLAVAVGATLLLLATAEVAYAHDDQVRRALLVLSAQVLCAPFVGVARAHFQAAQRGQFIALGDVALAAGMLGGTAVAVAADLGFTGLVAGVASGYVLQALALTAVMPRDLRFAWTGGRWGRLLAVALPLGGTMVLNYLYFRLDVFLLSVLRDKEAVAVYGLAYRVLEGLMVLPAYFMFALFPEIARSRTDRLRVDAIVDAAMRTLEALALPIVLLGIVFADDIVAVIGDPGFEGASAVLRLLMLALGISYLNGVYGNALPALGRQGQMFRWSAVVLAVNLVVNLALIPPLGVRGAAIAVVVSEAAAFFAVRGLYRPGGTAPRLLSDPRILLAAAVMVACVAPKFLLPDDFGTALPTVIVGGLFGLAVYGGALVGLRAVPPPVAAQLSGRLSRLGRSR